MNKILAFLIGMGIAGIVILALNFIPWAIWNKVIVPAFGVRAFTFWQIFFICMGISWLGRLLFGSISKSK